MATLPGGQRRSRPTASESDVITEDVVRRWRLPVRVRHLPHETEDGLLPLPVLRLHGADGELDHWIMPRRHSPELREQVLRSTDRRLALTGEDVLLSRRL